MECIFNIILQERLKKVGDLKINFDVQEIKTEEFIPYNIGDYKIFKPLTSNKSGFSKWGIAFKDDVSYFIKEFLTPVYPDESVELSEEIRNSKIEQCNEWFDERNKIYRKIVQSQNGNLIVPRKFFKDKSHFYLVTKLINKYDNVNFENIKDSSDEQKQIILKVLAHSFSKLAENHVVHADVKPDNLIFKKTVNDFFTVKIIDFDASYRESNPPFGDEIQGDFVYLAPETFIAMCEEDIKLTPKVDVFALGIIFHQILCGELPGFSNEYDYVYEAVLNDDKIQLNQNIIPGYRKLIEKMLAKEADDRCSISEVLAELYNFDNNFKPDNKSIYNGHSKWKFSVDFD